MSRAARGRAPTWDALEAYLADRARRADVPALGSDWRQLEGPAFEEHQNEKRR